MSKYDEIIKQNSGNMSHNVYSEDNQNTLTKLPKYMLLIEKSNDFRGNTHQEMIPCDNFTTAIRIVKEEKAICTLFSSIDAKGKYYEYVCDMSFGVC